MSAPSPFPAAPPARVLRLGAADASAPVWDSLAHGSIVARAEAAVVELTGPGAVTCLQGLFTNDVEEPGDGGFAYGALLTPKGMIVVDGWAARSGATVRLAVPAVGADAAVGLLGRSVPPRLARTADRTADLGVLRLAGPRAAGAVEGAGLPVPAGPGRLVSREDVEVARTDQGAPFAFQITAPRRILDGLVARLAGGGARSAPATALELARILAGWPGLGAEVDAKTIPQEVRYDEIGGVSYTKGCYTGQETVSRLHFRGHANRVLRGLELDAAPPAQDEILVRYQDRDVGRVTSVAVLPGGRWIGLAVLRREVAPDALVTVGDGVARVVSLPFPPPRPEPA